MAPIEQIITETLPLPDVAAIVAAALAARKMRAIVVGASAATMHAPMLPCERIDVVVYGIVRAPELRAALTAVGYARLGALYRHARSRWPLAISETFPYIGGRAITEFTDVATRTGEVTTLVLTDAIAQRVYAWVLHAQADALNAAKTLVQRRLAEVKWDRHSAYADDLKRLSAVNAGRTDSALRELARLAEV